MAFCTELKTIIKRGFRTAVSLNKEVPKNLKGKKHSSQLWLTRQLRDPYVEKAKQENYRCRSAFKLLEINKRFNILKPGYTVIDCGAAPGSWTQVITKCINSVGKDDCEKQGKVIAIDRLPIHPIDGAIILGSSDFTCQSTHDKLKELLNGDLVDVVVSDMAPNATGVSYIDHEQIINLAYSALKFALQTSRTDGTFITKVWDGIKSKEFENDVLKFYKTIKFIVPAATRTDSAEKFILARGFRGLKT